MTTAFIFEYLIIGAIYVCAFACFSSQRDEVLRDFSEKLRRYGFSLILGLALWTILFVIGWPIIAAAQVISAIAKAFRRRS